MDLENIDTVTDVKSDTGTAVPEINEISELGRKLRDADTLYNHIVTNTGKTADGKISGSQTRSEFSFIG